MRFKSNLVKYIGSFALIGSLSFGFSGCKKQEKTDKEYIPVTVTREVGRLPDNPQASKEYLESPYIINIKTRKGEKYTVSLYGEGFGGKPVKDLEDKIDSGKEIRISKKTLESIREGDRVSHIHTSNLKLD